MKDINLRILYLYPDLLELYGDRGNIEVLKYRLGIRNINHTIDTYCLGDPKPNFMSYDLIFAGGGADNEQQILSSDIAQFKEDLKTYVENGKFVLLICGAFQLFGKYYMDVNGVKIPGLDIFPYYTKAIDDPKKRSIGNIILENKMLGKVIGFENHGGQTYDIENPFGTVLFGKGNNLEQNIEGFFKPNVIGTYLHGPLLSKNPVVCDYIIAYCLNTHLHKLDSIQTKEDIYTILPKIDDEFEEKARDQLFKRFLKE